MILGFDSAVSGMRGALDALDATSSRIARTAPWGDLASDMVGLMVAERSFEANAIVARTGDEMIGSLLDVLA